MIKQFHGFRWITISLLLTFAVLNLGCASKVQPTEVGAKQTVSSIPIEQELQTPEGALEITNVSVSKPSFNPTQGEDVQLSYTLSKDANVTVKVYDPDHYLAQNLIVDEFQQAGSHKLIWDGKDLDGNIVPDHAYFFTIEARDASGNTVVYDPTIFSGGEEYDIADVQFDREANTVAFNLPKAAWVRGWFGIKGGGPLVKLLLDWEPRPAGENIVFWDGKDEDGVANVFEHKDFVYRILTNTFPENSVIAIGNKGLSYREYKEQPNLQREKKLERPESLREGVKFSSHAKIPRTVDRAPSFTVSFPNLTPPTEDDMLILKGKTLVQIALDEADIDYMIQFRYEIAFYVDYQLYAEQEEGVSPFNWVWDPTGIPPGEHILTVNVVSLMDQIGIKNLKFIME